MNEQANNVIPMPVPQTAGAKFTITATLDGFPITVELEGKAENLKAVIERLKAIGAQPPMHKPASAEQKAAAPICPHHSKPMKPSRKPGSFFCPHRMENGEYCPEKA